MRGLRWKLLDMPVKSSVTCDYLKKRTAVPPEKAEKVNQSTKKYQYMSTSPFRKEKIVAFMELCHKNCACFVLCVIVNYNKFPQWVLR